MSGLDLLILTFIFPSQRIHAKWRDPPTTNAECQSIWYMCYYMVCKGVILVAVESVSITTSWALGIWSYIVVGLISFRWNPWRHMFWVWKNLTEYLRLGISWPLGLNGMLDLILSVPRYLKWELCCGRPWSARLYSIFWFDHGRWFTQCYLSNKCAWY